MNDKNRLVELRKELKTLYSDIGLIKTDTIKERLHEKKERLIEEINEIVNKNTFDREKHIAKVKDQNNNNGIYKGSDEFSKAGRLHRRYQKQEKHRIFNNSVQD